MATTIEGTANAERLVSRMAGIRQGLRAYAADIQSLSGRVNALSGADLTKLTDALTAKGLNVVAMKTELTSLVNLGNNIMSTVQDTSDLIG